MTTHLFICNPSSGRGLGERKIAELKDLLAGSDIRGELHITGKGGEGREIARREATNYKVIASLGGDGTIQEVAGGLAEARLNAPVPHTCEFASLGILPAGTGNDLTKAIGIPHDLSRAFALLMAGNRRDMDLGRIRWHVADDEILRERIFANNVGLGFEGQVGWAASRIKLPLRGMPLYMLALLRVLVKLTNPDLRVVLFNGHELTGPALLLSIGIGRCSGGGFYLNPDADPFDGLLDICHVKKLGRLQVLRFLPHAMRGTHGRFGRRVTMRRDTLLDLYSDTPCHGHADGELLGDRITEARVVILPGILPVIC
ncbi:MAG: hypothetical protein GY835_13305 [bacterium]|nr:hypothetical protein [bacterium]